MKAKEMFEKMGFEYSLYKGNICYTDELIDVNIIFSSTTKMLYLDNWSGVGLKILGMNLLKAINKQCEELGWIGVDKE